MTEITPGSKLPLRLIADADGPDAYALRDYLTRSEVPFLSVSVPPGSRVAEGVLLAGRQLPLVLFADGQLLERPTPAQVASALGWVTPPGAVFRCGPRSHAARHRPDVQRP